MGDFIVCKRGRSKEDYKQIVQVRMLMCDLLTAGLNKLQHQRFAMRLYGCPCLRLCTNCCGARW